jgi:hypothetical protein
METKSGKNAAAVIVVSICLVSFDDHGCASRGISKYTYPGSTGMPVEAVLFHVHFPGSSP